MEWLVQDWGILIRFEKNAKQKIVYLMDPSGDDEHHSFVGTRDDIS